MAFPVEPPVEPMLAKTLDELPRRSGFLYEPKWDGFRAIIFEAPRLFIQSRDLRPLDRYFPELSTPASACCRRLRRRRRNHYRDANGLDFDALQQRIHPAASRIASLPSHAGIVRRLRPAGDRRTRHPP